MTTKEERQQIIDAKGLYPPNAVRVLGTASEDGADTIRGLREDNMVLLQKRSGAGRKLR